MEYALNGVILGKSSMEVEGTKYFNKDFSTIPGVIPVKQTPTLLEGQTFDWNEGSEINGEWVRFVVRDKTAIEKMAEIRGQRNSLLDDTDKYGLSDVTMTTAMTAYRQALRDLPASVDVNKPVFPTKP